MNVPEALRRNEEERRALHNARVSEREEQGRNLSELVLKFNREFDAHRTSILRQLAALEQENENPNGQDRDREQDQLPERFDSLVPQLTELQRILSSSVIFLPAFEIRVAREGYASLEKRIADVRNKLIPRSSFQFRAASLERLEKDYRRRQALGIGGRGGGGTDAEVEVVVEPVSNVVKPEAEVEVEYGMSIADLTGEIVYRSPTSLPVGSDFAMARLTDCVVSVCAPLTALRLYDLARCKVYVGAVTGSLLIEQCSDCVIVVAVHQARIHHTFNTDFYVHTRSGPIIEHCKALRFAPYVLAYPELEDQLKAAKLGFPRSMSTQSRTGTGQDQDQDQDHGTTIAVSKWDKVQDFRWLRVQKSPNWTVLPEAERLALGAVKPVVTEEDRRADAALHAACGRVRAEAKSRAEAEAEAEVAAERARKAIADGGVGVGVGSGSGSGTGSGATQGYGDEDEM